MARLERMLNGVPPGHRDVVRTFSSLKDNPQFSDFKIICGNKEWSAHKLVCCPQSRYFNRLFNGSSKWTENQENMVDWSDERPQAIRAMLHFLYEQDYDDTIAKAEGISPIVLSVWVYALADKRDILHLATAAASKFCSRAQTEWQTTAFAQAVRELYENAPDNVTSRGMRRSAVQVSSTHASALLENEFGKEFRKVMSDVTVFGTEFQLASIEYKNSVCATTGKHFRLRMGSSEQVVECPECGWLFN